MNPTTVTVTITISKRITPGEEAPLRTDTSPSYPSARIAAVISAVTAAIDLRHLYADLGQDTTVTFTAAEEDR